jgi:dienelactone hydrolase
VVDTARHPSSGGSYRGVDPFGLFWSAEAEELLDFSGLHPMRVVLRASCDDLTTETSYVRPVVADAVTRVDVDDDDARGIVFQPPSGSGRGVVVLAGSDGGPGSPLMGALLARHGTVVLSLAHWNHPGTPEAMSGIDVEVVIRAAEWLRAQDGVADEPPALIGISRAGELALLAATLVPDAVGPVVSLVGSGVPWGAFGPGADDNDPAWLFEGRPVPKAFEVPDDPGLESSLADSQGVAAAEIPIERATGPVLLLSGEDDAMWPSTRLSRIAEERAVRLGAADRVTHVAYPDAGHFCTTPPGFAVPAEVSHPVIDVRVAIGGSRAGNQAARLDAWRRIREHVGAAR